MNIKITEMAREKLSHVFSDSEFTNPALRLIFSGFG